MKYQNSPDGFLPETQAERIKRYYQNDDVYFSAAMIGKIIGKNAEQKLHGNITWSEQEVQMLAETAGLPLKKMVVPCIPGHIPDKKKRPVRLADVANDGELLSHFCGCSLDSRTRDTIVRFLLQLEEYLDTNKDIIKHRRQRERARNKKRDALNRVYKRMYKEYNVTPTNLCRIKLRKGNYGQFERRFRLMWEEEFK